jgi:Rv2175c C-terminal domain of unknown function
MLGTTRPGSRRSEWLRHAGPVSDLDALVTEWLTLPDVAEQLGVDVGRVRRLMQERFLLAVRRGDRAVLSVPAALVSNGAPLAEMPGTLTVLYDAGYDEESALRWLLTADESLPGSPIEALRAGRKTEVRRRAQATAF